MFIKNGSIGRFGGPLLVDRIVTNSVTVAVGDIGNTASGFFALGTTGTRILGVVESIVGKDGFSPVKDGTYLGNPGDTYAAESDNQTDKMVKVRVDIDTASTFVADLDATIATTTGSNLAGKTFDIADEDQVDESTVAETKQQLYSHGPHSVETGKIVVNILESEVFGM